jgi:hypothetical protein
MYLAFGDLPSVQGIFYGIKPAVVAVVLFAAWRIGSRSIRNAVLLAIAALAFVGIFFFKIEFPWIVLAAGILGAIGGKLMPASSSAGGGHGAGASDYGPALIDDDTPPPRMPLSPGASSSPHHWRFVCRLARPGCWRCAAMPTSFTWANSSPRRPSSPLAVPTPCCPTSIRAGWSTSAGSPGRR